MIARRDGAAVADAGVVARFPLLAPEARWCALRKHRKPRPGLGRGEREEGRIKGRKTRTMAGEGRGLWEVLGCRLLSRAGG